VRKIPAAGLQQFSPLPWISHLLKKQLVFAGK